MNRALKKALLEADRPAYEVARDAGMHYSKLSRFVLEMQQPTERDKAKIAQALQRDVGELFPEAESVKGY